MPPTICLVTNGTHARRRALLRASLAHSGFDALLVTDLINVRYLTGFTGSNAALLVLDSDDESGDPDNHHRSRTDRHQRSPHPVLHRRPLHHPGGSRGARPAPADLATVRPCAAAPSTRRASIGFEAMSVTVAAHGAMTATADENPAAIDLTPTTDVVERTPGGEGRRRDRLAAPGLRGRRPGPRGADRGGRDPAGPDRTRGRARPGPADAGARRRAIRHSRRSSRPGQQRHPAPPADRRGPGHRRLRQTRLRRHRRRLPLRHDPHVRARVAGGLAAGDLPACRSRPRRPAGRPAWSARPATQIDAASRDRDHRRRLRAAVLARSRARRRAADPRSAEFGARIGKYHGPGHVRHRRARGLPAGARRSAHRGQRRDPRGRL